MLGTAALGLLLPVAAIAALGSTHQLSVLSATAAWRYKDAFACNTSTGGAPQGWPSSTAAAQWPSGVAPLGFGLPAGTVATTIYGVDVNPNVAGIQRAPTAYFQTTFSLSSSQRDSVLAAAFASTASDGVVVFVNGVEGTTAAWSALYPARSNLYLY